ncbi:hypothetical protein ACFPPA_05560 [Rhodanobacter ginsengisoli]|uniref:Uncharacterized protein n=1 Tax=Rhodanobacter ginsengisoli TaxID=418646 RepID=A0ABW0QLH3_9GAMM
MNIQTIKIRAWDSFRRTFGPSKAVDYRYVVGGQWFLDVSLNKPIPVPGLMQRLRWRLGLTDNLVPRRRWWPCGR